MKKIPLDVVLLPPKDVHDLAIKINKELLEQHNDIILGNKQYVPHISLSMGVIKEEDLDEVVSLFKKISQKTKPLLLKISQVRSSQLKDGRFVSELNIENTKDLQELHEELVLATEPFFEEEADISELKNTDGLEMTLHWALPFVENSAFEKFNPHITVGIGKPENAYELPETFIADTLAVYVLGKYCTCKDLIEKIELE